MKNKKKHLSVRRYFWPFMLSIGVILFLLVLMTAIHTDMVEKENQLSDTVNYIKKQCATYSTLHLASETKSLMRIIECVQQINRNLQKEETSVKTEDALKEYTTQLYLTGILLLDEDGKIEHKYASRSSGLTEVKEEIKKQVVLDVADNPQKTYTARVSCKDNTYLDLAAFGRTDKKGIVVAYYYTPREYVKSYGLSFQNILAGYSVEQNGTIVITKEDKIVASNDLSMEGKEVDTVPILSLMNQRGKNGVMIHVKDDSFSGRIFGVIDRGRDYYVYAYMPEREIFEGTPRKLLYAAMGYLLAIIIIQMVRWKTEKTYQKVQLERERSYQEELREAAKNAQSASIAKTEFLQRMSHDIRTPINGIRGMIEMAEHYDHDFEKQKECRDKIWEASGLLLELVNEVLDMGKLESGEVVLESREFNVLDLIHEITQVLEKQATAKEIEIICEKPLVHHPNLIGSPLHLKRLLMNIMSNAIKYNKQGGKIFLDCVETKQEKNRAFIDFICADTGIGMSEEFQKHLFEPFVQENSDARSTYEGTGLGMAITKSLVDKMEGTIEFESKQGFGTLYRISIPFEIDENVKEVEMEKETGETNSLKGMHVLLVEDNELNMEIAEFLLKRAEIIVKKAKNGKEALECVERSQIGEFDVILMDIMMPVMNGYEATKAIRALNREDAKTIPIIAMTANAFAEDRQKSHEMGMNDHITKPLESKLLLKILEKYKKQ